MRRITECGLETVNKTEASRAPPVQGQGNVLSSWKSPILLCVCSLIAIGGTPGLAEETSLAAVFNELNSSSFLERTTAQRKLSEVASANIDKLSDSAIEADSEVAQRIVEALESVFLKSDGAAGEQAEIALRKIAQSGRPASVGAGLVLQGNARLCESRARVALEKLGAQFVYYSPYATNNGGAVFHAKAAVLPDVGVGFGPAAVLHSIYLHEDWTGKKEDLWHFIRLSNYRDLEIYSIQGNGIDLIDLFILARSIRGLRVVERGACLGITTGQFQSPCQVGRVMPEGAAGKGGIQTDDVIVGLDEIVIRNFPHLVQTLQGYKIGDEVTFTIFRNGEELQKQVTLASWRSVMTPSKEKPNGTNPTVIKSPTLFGGPFGKPVEKPSEDLKETSPQKNDSDAKAPGPLKTQ